MPGVAVLALLILAAVLAAAAPASEDALQSASARSTPADVAPAAGDRSTAGPRTLYVAADGSNGGRCTQARPCTSFNRAYHVARPGDTVQVAGGRYPSQTLLPKAGAAPPRIVIRRAPGARVVVGDPGATVECIEFEGARYVTVRGLKTPYTRVGGMRHQCGVTIGRSNAHHVTLRNIDAGMIWFGADNVRVIGGDFGPGIDENTKIEFATGHPPRDILIDGAVFHHGLSYQQHPECFALWGGTRITIRNSRFSNCQAFHLWIVASEGDTISNVLIEGNTFTQPEDSIPISSTIKVGDKGGTLRNIVLRRNRVLTDEMYVLQGYGDGGTGNITIVRNRVRERITLGSHQNCMVDRTYRPRPGVSYRCRRNVLVD